MTSICLLGASGSIGQQTLDVINKHREDFTLVAFSVGKNTRKISSILTKNPNVKYICVGKKQKASYYQEKYPKIHFFYGDDGLNDLIKSSHPNMVVNALVGFVGLKPSITTLENHIDLALANKESLVVGGELINKLLTDNTAKLFPIDSEHSALWKCLKVDSENVDKLLITASGGAFRDLRKDELNNVTKDMALNHPNWNMGAKITIDCATMVNKSFEIIEAFYLFHYPLNKIQVQMHRESMVHSLVKYKDGTLRAEISYPDMRNPIQFALYRGEIPFDTVYANDLSEFKDQHFSDFDKDRYPLVSYAETVIKKRGGFGAVYNAANEVAVHAFLDGKIQFVDIDKIINYCMSTYRRKKDINYEILCKIDKNTRKKAMKFIKGGLK